MTTDTAASSGLKFEPAPMHSHRRVLTAVANFLPDSLFLPPCPILVFHPAPATTNNCPMPDIEHPHTDSEKTYNSSWEQVPQVMLAEVDLNALLWAYQEDQSASDGEEGEVCGPSLNLEQEILAFYSSVAASVGLGKVAPSQGETLGSDFEKGELEGCTGSQKVSPSTDIEACWLLRLYCSCYSYPSHPATLLAVVEAEAMLSLKR